MNIHSTINHRIHRFLSTEFDLHEIPSIQELHRAHEAGEPLDIIHSSVKDQIADGYGITLRMAFMLKIFSSELAALGSDQ